MGARGYLCARIRNTEPGGSIIYLGSLLVVALLQVAEHFGPNIYLFINSFIYTLHYVYRLALKIQIYVGEPVSTVSIRSSNTTLS